MKRPNGGRSVRTVVDLPGSTCLSTQGPWVWSQVVNPTEPEQEQRCSAMSNNEREEMEEAQYRQGKDGQIG